MAVRSVRRAVRGLAKVSIANLNREMTRRRKAASRLEIKRSKLLSRVADLEREIRGLGGSLNGSATRRGHGNAGRPRTGRSETLPQALAKLLNGKTMSVTDMSHAVQNEGYVTHSPNFRTIVNAAMITHTDLFRRVSRGQYTAK